MRFRNAIGFTIFLIVIFGFLFFASKRLSPGLNATPAMIMWLVSIVAVVLFGIIIISIFVNHVRERNSQKVIASEKQPKTKT